MIAVCQQPNYFPTMGYIEQCARADQLILLDSVQWIKQGVQHRTKIIPHLAQVSDQNSGKFQWLTLPIQSKNHRSKTFGEIKLMENDGWHQRHWKTLQAIYSHRPYFKSQLEPIFKPWFEQADQYQTLSEATIASIKVCLKALDIKPELHLSSQLNETGCKSERLISLCKSVNADMYYSGLASTSYIDTQAFRDANIQLIWQRWKYSEYDQGRDGVFKSHLSILDAFANTSIEEIKGWIEIKPWGPFGDLTKIYNPENDEFRNG